MVFPTTLSVLERVAAPVTVRVFPVDNVPATVVAPVRVVVPATLRFEMTER